MCDFTEADILYSATAKKNQLSRLFDEVIDDGEINYSDAQFNSWVLAVKSDNSGKFLDIPEWLNEYINPQKSSKDKLEFWNDICNKRSPYYIAERCPKALSGLTIDIYRVNEETMNIIGGHSRYFISNFDELNDVLKYYLSKLES